MNYDDLPEEKQQYLEKKSVNAASVNDEFARTHTDDPLLVYVVDNLTISALWFESQIEQLKHEIERLSEHKCSCETVIGGL